MEVDIADLPLTERRRDKEDELNKKKKGVMQEELIIWINITTVSE